MKRILLVVVIAIVGGLALAHYKITSKIREGLDGVNMAMSVMGGSLRYGNVSVSLNGDTAVSDLQFRIPTGDDLSIDKVVVGTGSPLDLLSLPDKLQQRQLPNQLHLQIEGLLIDLDRESFSALGEASPGGSDNPLRALEAVACGDRTFFDYHDLNAMGYDQLTWDVDMSYQISHGGTRLDLTGDLTSRDQLAVHTELAFDQSVSFEGVEFTPALVDSIRLAAARLDYTDKGELMRIMEFCAKETGMDVAAYRTHHLEAWKAVWNKQGLAASDNVYAVYEDYITNPGNTMTFEIAPYPPLDMSDDYVSSDPDYLSQRLNPKIGSEHLPLSPFTISAVEPVAMPAAPAGTESDGAVQPSARQTASAGSDTISVRNLEQHLNKAVVISLTDGRSLDGRIQSVRGDRMQLRRHVYGGVIDVPVELQTITAIRLQ